MLVVEDEDRVRNYSVEALAELGYTVFSAASGLEALKLLEGPQPVTLLFTDIVMPEMTGRQPCRARARAQAGPQGALHTGYTRNAAVHNGVLEPGTNALAKPFTIEQLAAKIRATIGG